MKVLMLAGVIAAVAFPTAAAAEAVSPCQTEDARSALTSDRVEQTIAPAPPAVARQAAAPRETAEARSEPARRRSGKRVPDAELIGPRGAL
ncbi:MAG TPA: hypothetical protein PLK37_03685 [Terricaulis sp.]|nr:hypothetical protein [Terricaulis sp.]